MTTVRDIANQLGYSPGTISRCLSGHPDVKPATRQRVVDCARELGYKPRRGWRAEAAGKASRTVPTVGLLVGALCGLDKGEPDMGYIGHYVVEAMSTAATAMGLNLSVGFVDAQSDPAHLLDPDQAPPLLRTDVGGLVLLYPFHENFVAQHARQRPVVSLEQPYPGLEVDVISPNQSSSAMTAVRHLAEAGHRRIAFLASGCMGGYRFAVTRRLAGFMCGMAAEGLSYSHEDLLGAIDPIPTEQLTDAVRRRLDAGVTALVCSVERDGYLIWKQLGERGVKVPDDMSMVSIGGVSPMYGLPQMATMRLPYETLARAALRKLQARQKQFDRPATLTEYECDYVPGQSIAPPQA